MQLQLAVQEWKVEHQAGMGAGWGAQGHTVSHLAAAVAGEWLCAHTLWGQPGSPTHSTNFTFQRTPDASGVLVVLCAPPEPTQSSALVIFYWAAEGTISSSGLDPNCHHFWCKSLRNEQGERGSSAFQPLNHSLEGGEPFATTPPVPSHRSPHVPLTMPSIAQVPGNCLELSVVSGFECSIWGC